MKEIRLMEHPKLKKLLRQVYETLDTTSRSIAVGNLGRITSTMPRVKMVNFSLSSSLFVLHSTDNLWKAMAETQNELLRWERSKTPPPVSITQGSFEDEEKFLGGSWKLDVEDQLPLPGIPVRRVNYEITWSEGEQEFRYSSDLYVKAQ